VRQEYEEDDEEETREEAEERRKDEEGRRGGEQEQGQGAARLGTPDGDVFLRGLRAYLRAHEYGAATAAQLWAALSQVRLPLPGAPGCELPGAPGCELPGAPGCESFAWRHSIQRAAGKPPRHKSHSHSLLRALSPR